MFRIAIVFMAALLWCGPAAADPPHGKGHGHGKGHKEAQGGGPGYGRGGPPGGFAFSDHARMAIAGYYGPQIASGKCPPGLAKKGTGCLPPGQARKWAVGQPLPAGVAYYPLPPDLLRLLTPAPVGYRYARVGTDILMIAAGTGLVVSGITDLLR
jgi:hypothetical protein